MSDGKIATTITGGQIQGVAGAGSVVIENFTIINRAAEEPAAAAAGAEPIPTCPYPGLAYFGPNDSHLFFGRDAAIARLTEAVGQQSLTALVGASGSGKSSVVLAGLAPHLNAAAEWRFSHFRIGNERGHDPFLALARALVPLYVASDSDTERLRNTKLLATSLQAGELTLADVFADCRSRNKGRRILLIVDQFEETFTLVADEAVRHRFIEVLLAGFPEAAPGSVPDISLIMTLRADFYGLALRHRPLADALQSHVENLGPMKREELEAAITRPAENVKVSFEPGLVETLLDDVVSKPGGLPLLQFALREMWGRLDHRRMTRACYDAIGGVEGALAQRAQAIYDALTSKGEDAQAVMRFRRLFTRLVTLGEGAEDTRRIVAHSELGEDAWALAQRLAGEDNRLVITSAPSPDHETAEVVHEALIRNWPLLIEWVNRDRAFQSWLRQLKPRVDEWRADPNDQGTLLRGGALAVAEDWLGRRHDELSTEERAFIEASIASREAARRQEEEALAREHARLAEIATAQARMARIQRIATGALAGVGVLMLAMLGNVLWQQYDTARRETAVYTNLAAQAMKDEQFDRAMRYALQGNPPPGAMPWAPFSKALEGKLAGGALSTYLRRVLRGHTEVVTTVAFSSDGKRMVTASEDGTARLWDAESGMGLAVLKGHEKALNSAAFSPDGKRVLTGSDDTTARLWDVESGKQIAVLQGHTGKVNSAAFSPDGKRVVTASDDKTARLWDAESGKVTVLQGHTEKVNNAAFSPDGKRVLTASWDKTARLWDAESGKGIAELKGHEGTVTRAAFSPDGKRAVTASDDGTARLWATDSGKAIAELKGHMGAVFSAAFSPDGKRVVTAAFDPTPRLWDAESGKEIVQLKGHSTWALIAAFSPDGNRLVTASSDGTARLWDAESGTAITVLQGHTNGVWSAAFSPDSKRVATGSNDKTARLWDVENGEEIAQFKGHTDVVRSAAFSPDGKRVVTASSDKTARLWDAESAKVVAELKGHTNEVNSAAFSPDGKRVVTASDDKTARLWDAESAKVIAELKGHTDRVWSAAFSPDGKRVVTASDDYTARLWDAESGKEIAQLKGHTDAVLSAAFSPDGKRVVTASNDTTARLWDAESGKEVAQLKGSAAPPWSAAFSPDGKRVVTSHPLDKMARLWDAESGKEIAQLKGHADAVWDAAFSSDGRHVVTASNDNTARLWDADSGKEVAALKGHLASVLSAAFSPDGTRVVTASQDGTARLWDVTWATKVRGHDLRERVCAEKLVGAAQEFSPDELEDPILGGVTQRNPCLRRGPLALDYWTRLPGEWWAWIRGADTVTSAGH
jgi:WD40 repeat protein